jgi:hypothetical protein
LGLQIPGRLPRLQKVSLTYVWISSYVEKAGGLNTRERDREIKQQMFGNMKATE